MMPREFFVFSANVHISKDSEKSIHFMKHWFENPNDYSPFNITFQNKEYDLINEMLFALIINEFKKKVEKDYSNTLKVCERITNKTKFRRNYFYRIYLFV